MAAAISFEQHHEAWNDTMSLAKDEETGNDHRRQPGGTGDVAPVVGNLIYVYTMYIYK